MEMLVEASGADSRGLLRRDLCQPRHAATSQSPCWSEKSVFPPSFAKAANEGPEIREKWRRHSPSLFARLAEEGWEPKVQAVR